ncbi:MAG: hypothetical protein QOE70_4486 [Chthoniobacter sp.]|jgi:LysM repeat protein|nr:hypothetical protein [Chthoniobacter sp.]
MKLQVPQFLTKRPAFLTRIKTRSKPTKTLHAATAARRMSPSAEDDYDDEPTTRLSSAFFVVLILHVVAVGGIYAFNSIKAHRRGLEPASAKVSAAKPEPVATDKPRTEAGKSETQPGDAKPSPATIAAAQAAAAQAATAPVSTGKFYHVKQGDTLTRIAASLGVTVAELQFVNSAKDLAVLRSGQIINVPAKKTTERLAAVEAPGAPLAVAAKKTEDAPARPAPALPKKTEDSAPKALARTYEVQKGDTATSIAKRFGVPVEDLLKLNKVTDPKKLQLGQVLKLPVKKLN